MNTKMFHAGVLSAVIVLISLGSGSLPAYAEKKIGRESVPEQVQAAFQKAYPQAVIRGYEQDVENGKTVYEIESKEGALRRDVIYNETGQVLEVEEVIKKRELPQAVVEAIHTQFPKADIVKAEKITGEGSVSYEVGLKQGTDRFSIELDSLGKNMKKA